MLISSLNCLLCLIRCDRSTCHHSLEVVHHDQGSLAVHQMLAVLQSQGGHLQEGIPLSDVSNYDSNWLGETYVVLQVGHHVLGNQERQGRLQARQGSHLQIQDQERQHQEPVQSNQQADRVQQGGRHQVQRPVLQ